MVKEVMHDPIFLALKSEPATPEDLQVAQDLLDTLIANREGCVGMAANMIGVRKRIIVFDNEGSYTTMFNPEILKATDPYETQEGCLSLLGGPRPCKRYKTIKVQWQNEAFQTREDVYIEVTSYGGDTTGYQIPFTLHYTGKKVKGIFDVATKTFTEA